MIDPISMLGECPVCFEPVLTFAAQQGLRLNWPAVDRARDPRATWSLVSVGDVWIAGNGEGERGTGHVLHRHQPAEAA